MKTKLEVYCAYLPYNPSMYNTVYGYYSTLRFIHTSHTLDENVLILRPLSALHTPMKHPKTSEHIECPAAWIGSKVDKPLTALTIWVYLTGRASGDIGNYIRQIDSLALELCFDIYGAIEKGWAVEVQYE